jgi:uroporphyrinogen-III synthase
VFICGCIVFLGVAVAIAPQTLSLAGRGIVITRPAHEAEHLSAAIRAVGGKPILFPALEIVPLQTPQLLELIDNLDRFDLAIFISPSAVTMALNLIEGRRAWPYRVAVAAVGAGSVRVLVARGVAEASDIIAPPTRFDSEALLERPELQKVVGKHIVIFRGEGGRELLAETLTARGAVVEYAECYRRIQPQLDPTPLIVAWQRGELHALTATSSEGVRNLLKILGSAGLPLVKQVPWFVPHPRIEQVAHELGVSQVVLTEQADDGLLAGLIAWFAVH